MSSKVEEVSSTSTEQQSIVHVVDDQEPIRTLVSQFLATVGIRCVTWSAPEALLASLGSETIHALVVDVRLVGMSGLELVRQLREKGVTAPAIFISGVAEVPVAVEAMKLGAHDFLSKPFTGQALIDAVQAALSRQRESEGRDSQVRHAKSLVSRLSPREREVFLAVVDGKANKVVAADLGLAEKTVEEHRKHVMTKLGASSVADLVKLAVLSGLCDPAGGVLERRR